MRVLFFLSPGVWQKRDFAQPVGGGVYELEVNVPQEGVYMVFVESQSQGMTFRQLPYLTLETTTAPADRDRKLRKGRRAAQSRSCIQFGATPGKEESSEKEKMNSKNLSSFARRAALMLAAALLVGASGAPSVQAQQRQKPARAESRGGVRALLVPDAPVGQILEARHVPEVQDGLAPRRSDEADATRRADGRTWRTPAKLRT